MKSTDTYVGPRSMAMTSKEMALGDARELKRSAFKLAKENLRANRISDSIVDIEPEPSLIFAHDYVWVESWVRVSREDLAVDSGENVPEQLSLFVA